MKKPRQIEVTFPDGTTQKYDDVKKFSDIMGWSYNYVRTRNATKGFWYRDHYIKRTGSYEKINQQ